MLILTRKRNESIVINDNIEITVLESDDGKVKLGIQAPKSVKVHRKEVYDQIALENKEASTMKVSSETLKALLKKDISKPE